MMAVMAVVAVLAGCQTTTDGYSSGVNEIVDCKDSKIWTWATVQPSDDGHCRVKTPTGSVTAAIHSAYFRGFIGSRSWRTDVRYVEPKQGAHAVALAPQDVLMQWDKIQKEATRLRSDGEAEYDGRTYSLFKFSLEGNGAECLGFVGYGPLQNAGYSDRVDGFTCHEKGKRLESQLRLKIDQLVIR
jgi:hypothetical protein